MLTSYYNPFLNNKIETDKCFLTGLDLTDENARINIFPDWVIDRFNLRGKKFKMIDQVSSITYEEMTLPCSEKVLHTFADLEKEVQLAFAEGFETMRSLSEEKLFLWIGKLVYGILYHDLLLEEKSQKKKDKELRLSSRLQEKFSLFHLMLQSAVYPVRFKGLKPWSIAVVRDKYSKDIFHYRDNPINLAFSLGVNGFGIIACIQDNGLVKKELEPLLNQINDNDLHPIQFEELCARFHYLNYLLRYKVQYNITEDETGVTIESLPINNNYTMPLFAHWDEKTYAQLLAVYWEPWGFTTQNITKFPEGVVTYLENEYTGELVDSLSITLPY